MATLPNLDKTVTKDPAPPGTDTTLTPIIAPADGTTALTTLVMNKSIDNINEIIDYISGDNGAGTIPQSAITTLITDLAAKLSLSGGTMTGNINLNDNIKIILGTGSDSEIYYDGTNLIINPDAVGGGDLIVGTQQLILTKTGSTQRFVMDRPEILSDGTNIGSFRAKAFNVSSASKNYAQIFFKMEEDTTNVEDGSIKFNILKDGSSVDILTLNDGNDDQIKIARVLNFNNNKGINLTDPTADQDITNKRYVDSLIQGIKWKDSVRAATTTNGALATAYENGDTIDGVVLVTGDRILLKNQTTGSENGIYTVNVSGAPTRATDYDVSSEVKQSAMFVEEGTVNADTGWVLTNDGTIIIGTTALVFVQFTSLGQIIAGSGLTKTGNTLDVIGTTNRIIANANSIDIDSSYIGQSSITTLGTITTGVWNGTDIVFGNVQDISTSRILGRTTAATGVIEELTGTNATTLLDTFTSALKGLAPASGGGTTNFLRADGTWVAPAGGGDMVLADVQTVTGAKTFGTIGGAVGKFILAGSTSGSTIVNAAAIAGSTTVTFQGVTGTVALLGDKLSAFAATTSAELAGVISDETGSGALVFATSPILVTPALGTPTSGVLTNCTGLPFSGLVALTSANILVGNGSNVVTSVVMSGDVTISNTGVTAIGALKVTNAMLAGSIALSKLLTDPLARANHTGTQLHTTISDFDTGVQTNRLDQMAIPTATLNINAQILLLSTSGIQLQEVSNLAILTIADDIVGAGFVIQNSDGLIKFNNGTGSAGQFKPQLIGVSKGSSHGMQLIGQIPVADDTGTIPVFRVNVRQDDSTTIDVRPLFTIANDAITKVVIDKLGNLILGSSDAGASATRTLGLINGVAPTGSITNGVELYSEDVSSSAELKVRDEAGNVTTLSPHAFENGIIERKNKLDWVYRSENKYIGKGIAISIMELAKEVEKLTGKNLIKLYDVTKEDWGSEQEEKRQRTQNEITRITPIHNELLSHKARLENIVNKSTRDEKDLENIINELKDVVIPKLYIKKSKPSWFNMKDEI